jgi:hypothetical protein
MVADKPGDEFGLVFGKAKAQRGRPRLLGALDLLVALTLARVVQEHGEIKGAAVLDLGEDLGGERVLLALQAALDIVDRFNGLERMLVDREMMVHVELGLPDDATELRQETAQHAGLVHQRQDAAGMVAASHDVEEHRPGFLIIARLARHGPERAARRRHRLRVNVDLALVGEPEQTHQLARVRHEHGRVGDGDAAAIEREALFLERLGRRLRLEPGDAGRTLFFVNLQLGAQDAGERADFLRRKEIALHEALDRGRVVALRVAQTSRHFGLQVEGQAFLGTAGEEVKVAADGPEEAGLAQKDGLVGGREGGLVEDLLQVGAAMDVLGEPEQGLQVAQAALAVLHIGLDAVA